MYVLTRRTFFQTAAAAAQARAATPANDRVTVGVIGSGGRALFETAQYAFFDNVEIVAVCDAQSRRRLNAKDTLEKLYAGRRRRTSYRGISVYADFRELLGEKSIDAVYIATPDHWHVSMLVAAMKAGKHVHCEKPLGVSVHQDLAALKAVRESRTVFQYGAERRSTADARKAIELVANGRIGKVEKIYVVAPPSASGASPKPYLTPPPGFDYDLWLGPAPYKPFCADRCLEASGTNGIFAIYDYSLGFIANWAAHPLDQVQRWADLTGRTSPPLKYEGSGRIASGGLFDTITHWDVRCTYSDGLVMHMVDHESYRKYAAAPHPETGWGRKGVTDVHNGAIFIGTEGWVAVAYEKVVTQPESLMSSEIKAGELHLQDTSLASIPTGMSTGHQQVATAAHHQNWVKAILGKQKAVGDIEGAVRSDLVSQLCDLCIRNGGKLEWDPEKLTVRGNESARRAMIRPMRKPWRV